MGLARMRVPLEPINTAPFKDGIRPPFTRYETKDLFARRVALALMPHVRKPLVEQPCRRSR